MSNRLMAEDEEAKFHVLLSHRKMLDRVIEDGA
jgi:hypothetical protein